MEYADTAPRLGRGRDRSEHGAKRSKADSPTATVGSRAALIIINHNYSSLSLKVMGS